MRVATVVHYQAQGLYKCVLCNEVLFEEDLDKCEDPQFELGKFVDRHQTKCLTLLPEEKTDDTEQA